MVANGWPILGLSVHSPEIEQAAITAGNGQLEAYGIAITRMGNFDINLAPEDAAQLKQLAKDSSYTQLAGGFGQYAAGEMALSAGRAWPRAAARPRARSWPPASGSAAASAPGTSSSRHRRPRPPAPAPAAAAAPGPGPDRRGLRQLLDVEPGRREVLHGLRPGDGPGREALHRVRHRAAGRGQVLRRLRHPGRLTEGRFS